MENAVIKISTATKARLMKHMRIPESFDEAINALLDEVEKTAEEK
jgi:hypothetical protein